MKDIKQVNLNQVLSSDQTISTGSEQDRRFINRLFDRFAGIFPAWHVSVDEATMKHIKREWMIGLVKAHVTQPEQYARGLDVARESGEKFLPAMGDFIKWCKGATLNPADNVVRPPYHLFERDPDQMSIEHDGSKKVSIETMERDLIKLGIRKRSDNE